MNRFLYSKKLLYILAAMLLLTFYLPDIIGPLPALIIGFLTIGVSLFVYNQWSKTSVDNEDPAENQKTDQNPEQPDEPLS